MRAFADATFGVAPEQVIGTTFQLKYEMGSNGVPDIIIAAAPLTDDNFAGAATGGLGCADDWRRRPGSLPHRHRRRRYGRDRNQ